MAKVDKELIKKQVIEILAEQLSLDKGEITEEASLTDSLGVDSFASIEIIFALERKFGIDITDKQIAKIKTVGDIVKYLSMRMARKKKR